MLLVVYDIVLEGGNQWVEYVVDQFEIWMRMRQMALVDVLVQHAGAVLSFGPAFSLCRMRDVDRRVRSCRRATSAVASRGCSPQTNAEVQALDGHRAEFITQMGQTDIAMTIIFFHIHLDGAKNSRSLF